MPLASTATVKSLQADEVAGLGYEMVLGNTFHLFIQPGHEHVAADGRPARVHGLGRRDHHRLGRLPGVLDGPRVRRRGGQAPRAERARPRTAASSRSRRRASASAPTSTAASGSWGRRPRWRSRPRSAPTSRSPSTSARPSTSTRDYTARSTERTHRWLDRCIAWHERERARRGSCFFGIVQGGVYEDLRARVGRARRAAPRSTASRSAARSARTRTRCARSWTDRAAPARRAAAPPARDRRRGRPRARGRGGHRHVRLRDARRGSRATARRWCPTRSARWRLDLAKAGACRQPRADRGRLPVPGLPRAHPRLPPLPGPRAGAHRACACSRSTTSPSWRS